MVAIIIPARDEEHRIGTVLRAATNSKLADEIIVVSDGSVDRTAEIARRFKNVKVIELTRNQGKGGAMAAAVKETKADILAFLDADLIGLRSEHVDSIIRPVLEDTADMCIGIFRGGKFWSDAAQKISPYFSGQRAIKRRLFERVPHVAGSRLGVETAITMYAKRYKARVLRVVLYGVSNTHKERKLGFVKGAKARVQMWNEIARAMVDVRKHERARRFRGKEVKPPMFKRKNAKKGKGRRFQ